MRLISSFIAFASCFSLVESFEGASGRRPLFDLPQKTDKPKLVLISGSPGTGKSTFGMSVALDQSIEHCISTDTIRAVMRSFVREDVSPALHRSAYAPAFEGDDVIRTWKETCQCMSRSIDELVQDAINKQTSLVVTGVHIVPSAKLIDKWERNGGVATGVLLKITKPEKHKTVLQRRGFLINDNKRVESYARIRAIQDEMLKLAEENNWIQVEQRTDIDPLDLITYSLSGVDVEDVTSENEANEFKLLPPQITNNADYY
mmetsp:Transcript_13818/g.15555  ORF Transcript_13818/g.15555 Transcript_13818/m.15555 type:complete len:260 (+) Transcript_13818:105-884(+)